MEQFFKKIQIGVNLKDNNSTLQIIDESKNEENPAFREFNKQEVIQLAKELLSLADKMEG